MSASVSPLVSPIHAFLACKTPQLWLEKALSELEVLLIDHANCEMKAASTALSLIYRHPEKTALVEKMSPLAREELLHFEKVTKIMKQRAIDYRFLSPSRYASRLLKGVDKRFKHGLVNQLIIGAIIEARSCERFWALIPLLDSELADFYQSLVKSEARHFEDYLTLAQDYAEGLIDQRLEALLNKEAELINSADSEFRFHSGIPA